MNASNSPNGVIVTRRSALHGAWALPAVAALGRLERGAPAGRRRGEDVAAFLSEWSARAQALVEEGNPNEDAHLHELCAALCRLGYGDFPARKKDAYSGRGMTTGPVHFEPSFLVVELELEPGAVIPAHNHVGFAFTTLAVRGEALARHFEPEPGAPTPDRLGAELELREVSTHLLTPGRTSSLTRSRANIHWFRAGSEGVRLLDFGVQFPDPGPGPATGSSLELDEEPRDARRRTFGARWIGNIYAKKD